MYEAMELSSKLLFCLVFMMLRMEFSEGELTVCSGIGGIKNGSTLNAEVNQPLTFKIGVCFGAQEVFTRDVHISRAGQHLGWYQDRTKSSFTFEITTMTQRAVVEVTLSETLFSNFNTHFSFYLSTKDTYHNQFISELTFVVFVNSKGTTPTTTTTRTSTETTITTSSTCPAPTEDKPECPPPMYLVEDDRCLQFILWDEYSSPDQQCQKFNGMLSSEATISWIIKCQTKISGRKILTSLYDYIDSTDGRQQNRNNNDISQFDVGCVIDRENLSSPKITSFYILIPSEKTIPLNNNSQHNLSLTGDTGYLSLVCISAGVPIPKLKISHWKIIQGEKNHYGSKQNYTWSLEAQCENSGTYTCVANSSLGSDQISATLQFTNPVSITNFVIKNRGLSELSSLTEKDSATLLCEASGCPSPGTKMSLVNERGELLPANQSTNSITYELTSVACSDMRRYYCRIHDESSQVQESQMELRIWNCASQLCSQEQQNNTITSRVNQTVHISVCVISPYRPYYSDKTDRTAVTFIIHEKSLIYYTVNIAIYNIQTSDSGQTNINLRNSNGILTYTFFLKVQETTEERHQTLDSGFHSVYAVIPVVLLVLAAIIGVVVNQIKKKQRSKAGQHSSSEVQDFREEGHTYVNQVPEPHYLSLIDYTPSPHYEEIMDI